MIDPWVSEIARQRQQERLDEAERHRLLATGAGVRAPGWRERVRRTRLPSVNAYAVNSSGRGGRAEGNAAGAAES
jgi:hypothetical protein